jgi:hypothetical protein
VGSHAEPNHEGPFVLTLAKDGIGCSIERAIELCVSPLTRVDSGPDGEGCVGLLSDPGCGESKTFKSSPDVMNDVSIRADGFLERPVVHKVE